MALMAGRASTIWGGVIKVGFAASQTDHRMALGRRSCFRFVVIAIVGEDLESVLRQLRRLWLSESSAVYVV